MTLWLWGPARPADHARRGHRKVAARRQVLALAGADGASATALQSPSHVLTTLPAPAGGGRRVLPRRSGHGRERRVRQGALERSRLNAGLECGSASRAPLRWADVADAVDGDGIDPRHRSAAARGRDEGARCRRIRLKAARARGRRGGRKFALTKAQVRLAQAAMAHGDTSVSALCRELGIQAGDALPVRSARRASCGSRARRSSHPEAGGPRRGGRAKRRISPSPANNPRSSVS